MSWRPNTTPPYFFQGKCLHRGNCVCTAVFIRIMVPSNHPPPVAETIVDTNHPWTLCRGFFVMHSLTSLTSFCCYHCPCHCIGDFMSPLPGSSCSEVVGITFSPVFNLLCFVIKVSSTVNQGSGSMFGDLSGLSGNVDFGGLSTTSKSSSPSLGSKVENRPERCESVLLKLLLGHDSDGSPSTSGSFYIRSSHRLGGSASLCLHNI